MTYRTVTESADVTPEILGLVEGITDGWYSEGPIDWEDVLDRLDGSTLEDGTVVDLGNELISPAIQKMKAHVRRLRKHG